MGEVLAVLGPAAQLQQAVDGAELGADDFHRALAGFGDFHGVRLHPVAKVHRKLQNSAENEQPCRSRETVEGNQGCVVQSAGAERVSGLSRDFRSRQVQTLG